MEQGDSGVEQDDSNMEQDDSSASEAESSASEAELSASEDDSGTSQDELLVSKDACLAEQDTLGAQDEASDAQDDASSPPQDDFGMPLADLVVAMEAVLFAAGEPLNVSEIKRVFTQYWQAETQEARAALLEQIPAALVALEARWREDARGFHVVEVAEGWTFRTRPALAQVVRAMYQEKPQRLSKPALETLAIIAYRQPVTKPEADHIRGVDCGGTLKVLLDRNLVRIVGKSEDVGRPLLYGTTKEFLSLFSLNDLSHLPSLREVQELSAEAQEELAKADVLPTLKELAQTAAVLRDSEEPAVVSLDEAVQALATTEQTARDAFVTQGMALHPDDVPPAALTVDAVPAPAAANDAVGGAVDGASAAAAAPAATASSRAAATDGDVDDDSDDAPSRCESADDSSDVRSEETLAASGPGEPHIDGG